MWRPSLTVAQQLSQYWNERRAGPPHEHLAVPDLDPTLIDTIERLHAHDDARLPDPRFIDRLERTLTEALASTPGPAPASPSSVVPTTGVLSPGIRSGRRSALLEAPTGRR